MTPAEPPDSYFHIRRLNPRRDLNAVADLVEAAFELKNDPEGAWVLRQMRAYARRAQSYPDIITLSGAPEGFVWEENGKIVGNISIVSYPRPEARIVLIANVAVASEYRRRGIASALTRHALRYISQWPRAEVWLQVRSENQAAIQMYHQLGFEFIYALSQWRYSPAQRLTASPRAGFPRARGLENASALARDKLPAADPLVPERESGRVFSLEFPDTCQMAGPSGAIASGSAR